VVIGRRQNRERLGFAGFRLPVAAVVGACFTLSDETMNEQQNVSGSRILGMAWTHPFYDSARSVLCWIGVVTQNLSEHERAFSFGMPTDLHAFCAHCRKMPDAAYDTLCSPRKKRAGYL